MAVPSRGRCVRDTPPVIWGSRARISMMSAPCPASGSQAPSRTQNWEICRGMQRARQSSANVKIRRSVRPASSEYSGEYRNTSHRLVTVTGAPLGSHPRWGSGVLNIHFHWCLGERRRCVPDCSAPRWIRAIPQPEGHVAIRAAHLPQAARQQPAPRQTGQAQRCPPSIPPRPSRPAPTILAGQQRLRQRGSYASAPRPCPG